MAGFPEKDGWKMKTVVDENYAIATFSAPDQFGRFIVARRLDLVC
ncbi:MAG TPA: hypothetical protein VGH19_20730 [Verrucomicrobiae bacterium]